MAMKSASKTKKRPLWKLNRREQTVCLVLLTGLLVGVSLPQRIIVATSDSLDHRIFFKVPVDTNKIKVDDYLLFQLQGDQDPFVRNGLKRNDILIKKVGCIPGEILTKDGENTFFCNQTKLGQAMEKDSKGNELPEFRFIGPIPEGSYFMIGINPRSFDSRYFGLIHADEFISKALPLW